MATDGYVQDTRIGTFTTALGADALFARRIDAEEGISELFTYRVEAISEDENIDFDAAIGRNATFSARTPRGIERHFDGILTEAEWIGNYDENHLYRLLIRPWLWLLSKTSDCRIFHEKSVVDIITEVMGAYPFADFEDALSQQYPKVEYTVQYRESDLAFVLRLMEKNGISYFFRHEPGSHKMILCDGQASFDEARGSARPWIERLDRMQAGEEYLFHWVRQRRFTTGEVTNTSYNFKTPDADMRSTARGLMGYANNDLEVYDYPGKHDVKADGEQYAKVVLEAEQAVDFHRVGEGDLSSCHPGEQMALEGHPLGDENTEWLMLKATHRYHAQDYRSGGPKIAQEQGGAAKRRSAAQHADAISPGTSSTGRRIASLVADPSRAQFDQGSLDDPINDENNAGGVETLDSEGDTDASTVSGQASGSPYHGSYEFIKADAAFKPPLKTQKTHIYGPQTAVVVGEGEIDCDEYGRILVKFHWDRLEDISRRVRVSQNWASKQWGGMIIPRIGMEVIVEFLEGDPDHPIVTGCVYHDKNMPPYSLPANKTKSVFRSDTHQGKGFNEFTFEDEKGREEIYLHGQRDHRIHIENSRSKRIDNNQSESIGHNKTIEVGNNHHEVIGGNMTMMVGPNVLQKGVTAAMGVLKSKMGDLLTDRLGAFTDKLGFLGALTMGEGNLVIGVGKNKAETVMVSSTEIVGAAKASTIGGGYQLTVGGVKNESVAVGSWEEVGQTKVTVVGHKYEIVCGKSRILMERDGTITIEGVKLLINEEKSMKVKAGRIDLN